MNTHIHIMTPLLLFCEFLNVLIINTAKINKWTNPTVCEEQHAPGRG